MITTNNNQYSDSPFEKKEYDFYDEIVISDSKRDFSRFFIGLFVFFIVSYATLAIISLILFSVLGKEAATSLFSNVYFNFPMGVLPMYCFALPLFYLIVRRMPERKPIRQDFGIKTFIALFPVCILFMTFGNYIGLYFNTVIGLLRGYAVQNNSENLVSASPVWLTFILTVVIAPIVEEFMFRKLMIGKLSRYGYGTAIIVSSIAFGLFHENLYQFFYAVLVGLLLGYIYVKSGSWLVSTLMHALINLYCSIIIPEISKIYEKWITLQAQYASGALTETAELSRCYFLSLVFSYMQLGLLFAGAIIFFVLIRKRSFVIADLEGQQIPKGRKAVCTFINIGGILYIVSSIVSIIANLY